MKIVTILLILIYNLVVSNGLVQFRSLPNRDSPLLMKILQSVDAATSDEHLFHVTLKLLKSLCLCMRETLIYKEKEYYGGRNSIDDDSYNTDGKVLDVYKKIYNHTCFNLRYEVANNIHSNFSNDEELKFLDHKNCGKHGAHKVALVDNNGPKKNVVKSQLSNILFQALRETKDYHKYRINRYNLFGKAKYEIPRNSKHSIIVILTLHPNFKDIKLKQKEQFINVGLNESLYTNSSIDIDIIDAKYDPKDKESEEYTTPEMFTDCNLQSIYVFLIESERKHLTKVFRILQKRGTIKVYIDVTTERNHTDYSSICCKNDTKDTYCTTDFTHNIQSGEDTTIDGHKLTKKDNLANSYQQSIAKIKDLVKLYTKKYQIENDILNVTEDSKSYAKLKPGEAKTANERAYSLVSEEPLKLNEVTQALLLLKDVVTKQTTKISSNMFRTDRSIPRGIYSKESWMNFIIFNEDNLTNKFTSTIKVLTNQDVKSATPMSLEFTHKTVGSIKTTTLAPYTKETEIGNWQQDNELNSQALKITENITSVPVIMEITRENLKDMLDVSYATTHKNEENNRNESFIIQAKPERVSTKSDFQNSLDTVNLMSVMENNKTDIHDLSYTDYGTTDNPVNTNVIVTLEKPSNKLDDYETITKYLLSGETSKPLNNSIISEGFIKVIRNAPSISNLSQVVNKTGLILLPHNTSLSVLNGYNIGFDSTIKQYDVQGIIELASNKSNSSNKDTQSPIIVSIKSTKASTWNNTTVKKKLKYIVSEIENKSSNAFLFRNKTIESTTENSSLKTVVSSIRTHLYSTSLENIFSTKHRLLKKENATKAHAQVTTGVIISTQNRTKNNHSYAITGKLLTPVRFRTTISHKETENNFNIEANKTTLLPSTLYYESSKGDLNKTRMPSKKKGKGSLKLYSNVIKVSTKNMTPEISTPMLLLINMAITTIKYKPTAMNQVLKIEIDPTTKISKLKFATMATLSNITPKTTQIFEKNYISEEYKKKKENYREKIEKKTGFNKLLLDLGHTTLEIDLNHSKNYNDRNGSKSTKKYSNLNKHSIYLTQKKISATIPSAAEIKKSQSTTISYKMVTSKPKPVKYIKLKEKGKSTLVAATSTRSNTINVTERFALLNKKTTIYSQLTLANNLTQCSQTHYEHNITSKIPESTLSATNIVQITSTPHDNELFKSENNNSIVNTINLVSEIGINGKLMNNNTNTTTEKTLAMLNAENKITIKDIGMTSKAAFTAIPGNITVKDIQNTLLYNSSTWQYVETTNNKNKFSTQSNSTNLILLEDITSKDPANNVGKTSDVSSIGILTNSYQPTRREKVLALHYTYSITKAPKITGYTLLSQITEAVEPITRQETTNKSLLEINTNNNDLSLYNTTPIVKEITKNTILPVLDPRHSSYVTQTSNHLEITTEKSSETVTVQIKPNESMHQTAATKSSKETQLDQIILNIAPTTSKITSKQTKVLEKPISGTLEPLSHTHATLQTSMSTKRKQDLYTTTEINTKTHTLPINRYQNFYNRYKKRLHKNRLRIRNKLKTITSKSNMGDKRTFQPLIIATTKSFTKLRTYSQSLIELERTSKTNTFLYHTKNVTFQYIPTSLIRPQVSYSLNSTKNGNKASNGTEPMNQATQNITLYTHVDGNLSKAYTGSNYIAASNKVDLEKNNNALKPAHTFQNFTHSLITIDGRYLERSSYTTEFTNKNETKSSVPYHTQITKRYSSTDGILTTVKKQINGTSVIFDDIIAHKQDKILNATAIVLKVTLQPFMSKNNILKQRQVMNSGSNDSQSKPLFGSRVKYISQPESRNDGTIATERSLVNRFGIPELNLPETTAHVIKFIPNVNRKDGILDLKDLSQPNINGIEIDLNNLTTARNSVETLAEDIQYEELNKIKKGLQTRTIIPRKNYYFNNNSKVHLIDTSQYNYLPQESTLIQPRHQSTTSNKKDLIKERNVINLNNEHMNYVSVPIENIPVVIENTRTIPKTIKLFYTREIHNNTGSQSTQAYSTGDVNFTTADSIQILPTQLDITITTTVIPNSKKSVLTKDEKNEMITITSVNAKPDTINQTDTLRVTRLLRNENDSTKSWNENRNEIKIILPLTPKFIDNGEGHEIKEGTVTDTVATSFSAITPNTSITVNFECSQITEFNKSTTVVNYAHAFIKEDNQSNTMLNTRNSIPNILRRNKANYYNITSFKARLETPRRQIMTKAPPKRIGKFSRNNLKQSPQVKKGLKKEAKYNKKISSKPIKKPKLGPKPSQKTRPVTLKKKITTMSSVLLSTPTDSKLIIRQNNVSTVVGSVFSAVTPKYSLRNTTKEQKDHIRPGLNHSTLKPIITHQYAPTTVIQARGWKIDNSNHKIANVTLFENTTEKSNTKQNTYGEINTIVINNKDLDYSTVPKTIVRYTTFNPNNKSLDKKVLNIPIKNDGSNIHRFTTAREGSFDKYLNQEDTSNDLNEKVTHKSDQDHNLMMTDQASLLTHTNTTPNIAVMMTTTENSRTHKEFKTISSKSPERSNVPVKNATTARNSLTFDSNENNFDYSTSFQNVYNISTKTTSKPSNYSIKISNVKSNNLKILIDLPQSLNKNKHSTKHIYETDTNIDMEPESIDLSESVADEKRLQKYENVINFIGDSGNTSLEDFTTSKVRSLTENVLDMNYFKSVKSSVITNDTKSNENLMFLEKQTQISKYDNYTIEKDGDIVSLELPTIQSEIVYGSKDAELTNPIILIPNKAELFTSLMNDLQNLTKGKLLKDNNLLDSQLLATPTDPYAKIVNKIITLKKLEHDSNPNSTLESTPHYASNFSTPNILNAKYENIKLKYESSLDVSDDMFENSMETYTKTGIHSQDAHNSSQKAYNKYSKTKSFPFFDYNYFFSDTLANKSYFTVSPNIHDVLHRTGLKDDYEATTETTFGIIKSSNTHNKVKNYKITFDPYAPLRFTKYKNPFTPRLEEETYAPNYNKKEDNKLYSTLKNLVSRFLSRVKDGTNLDRTREESVTWSNVTFTDETTISPLLKDLSNLIQSTYSKGKDTVALQDRISKNGNKHNVYTNNAVMNKLHKENVDIYNSRFDRYKVVKETVTKKIRYNTYQPTTKEDLDLLNRPEIPIIKTILYKRVTTPYKKLPLANVTACAVLKNLSRNAKNIQHIKALLKAAHCPDDNETNTMPKYLIHTASNGVRPHLLTKNYKTLTMKRGHYLDSLEKKNLFQMRMTQPKPRTKLVRRIQIGNKKKELMTMNTQDFFAQRKSVTQKNIIKEIPKPHPIPFFYRPMTTVPKYMILRPKFPYANRDFPTIDGKYLMRRKIDISSEVLTPDQEKMPFRRPHIKFLPRMATTMTPRMSILDRPLTYPRVNSRMFRDRMEPIRREKYLYKPMYEETTQNYVHRDLRPGLEGSDDSVSMDVYRKEPQVTDWWLDDMYLKVRAPLPINSNPGMVFPRRHFAKMEEVADLGALFIDDLLDYKEMLDRGELPLERASSREKGQPLCMEQFYRLLGVCRIPEVGRDRLEFPKVKPDGEESEELVVVACRNYFYPIPVKAADRGRLTPGEIQAQLLHAMVDAAGAPPAPRVGLLTSMNRDQWARAREQLIKDETNRTNMELISRALCLLCLDEAGEPPGPQPDTSAMLRAMHGAGTKHHSANRWFDKTVQLIISSDGTVGMCYEHSAAEGVAVVRLAERALARAEVADRPTPPPALLPAPLAMKWTIPGDVQRTIEQAARDLDRAIADLDFKVYTYRGYGREFMKSCRTSPDVYIQLALQYAYYKMYGHLVTTYESASLRRFRNGRVDNIRSAHGAALAWAAAMCTAETPPLNDATDDGQKKVSFNLYGEQKKLELFEEAARKQTAIMESNILGRGIDNHLLGLREAARETLGELPQIFTDDTYKKMTEFKLSTSQVATTTDGTFMGYGAVCPDGYGCSYNPKKECVIFCISSFHASSVTNTEAYRQSLEEALDSMKLMFQARKVDN